MAKALTATMKQTILAKKGSKAKMEEVKSPMKSSTKAAMDAASKNMTAKDVKTKEVKDATFGLWNPPNDMKKVVVAGVESRDALKVAQVGLKIATREEVINKLYGMFKAFRKEVAPKLGRKADEVSVADFARQFDESVPLAFGKGCTHKDDLPAGESACEDCREAGYRFNKTYLFINNSFRKPIKAEKGEKPRQAINYKEFGLWLGTIVGLSEGRISELMTAWAATKTGKVQRVLPQKDTDAGLAMRDFVKNWKAESFLKGIKITAKAAVVMPKTEEPTEDADESEDAA